MKTKVKDYLNNLFLYIIKRINFLRSIRRVSLLIFI